MYYKSKWKVQQLQMIKYPKYKQCKTNKNEIEKQFLVNTKVVSEILIILKKDYVIVTNRLILKNSEIITDNTQQNNSYLIQSLN